MFSKFFKNVTFITQLLDLLYQSRRRIYQLVFILLPCCFFYVTLPAHAAPVHDTTLPVEQEMRAEKPEQQRPAKAYTAQVPQSSVYISEFMASNGDTLADGDGEFSDWLELYNNDSAEVDLTGWYLTDDSTNLTKWQLPATTLGAGEYLVIFASSKDRAVAGAELHTNFKLTSGGEYLALVQPDSTTVASAYAPSYPAQFRDVSYGFDATLNERYFNAPTPGATNGSGLADLGAAITSATHTPTSPSGSDEITVAVTVTPGISPLSQVTLHYRVMFSETFTTTMLDDGTHGDGAANDGVYGASIPANVATDGEMVRYYITAEDSESRLSRYPFFQDPTGSAEYLGTVITEPAMTTQLPVLQWFISDTLAAETRTGTRASFFYDGAFYDNVFVRIRGGFSTSFPKKSFKIEFNQGEYFKFSPDQEAVDEFNLNTTYSDQSYIRPVLAFESYRDAGSIYSISFPMRVHRNASFYSVALFIEQPDSTYIRRQGLSENGALYKVSWNVLDVVNNRIEKKRPKNNDTSDLQAFIDGIHLTGDERTAYLFDHVNLPAAINYLATAFIIQDWDTIPRNYYLYRDTDGTGEWMIFPWDKDLTFANTISPNSSTSGHPLFGSSDYPVTYANIEYWNHLTDALYDTPAIQEMYLRRLRTLTDQLLKPQSTPSNQLYYETRLTQLLAQMEADAEEDRAIWGSYWGGFQSLSSEFAEIQNNYLRFRRQQLYNTHGPSGSGLIPEQQTSNVMLTFGPYEITPISSNPDEEYFTLVNPNQTAVDLSGWQIRFADQTEYTFQAGVVIPAQGTLYLTPDVNAFRKRTSSPTGQETLFVQGNYTARLADIGGPLELYNTNAQLIATQNVGNSQLANKVIVNELNYNPPSSLRRVGSHLEPQLAAGDDYEFIEIKNVDSSAVDLSGLSFTQGISYTFPANTTLAPNALFVLVRNASEFGNRYPTVTADGIYTGTLANEGERLTLVDTDGYIVTSFEYGNHTFWPQSPNGQGNSLIRRTPAGLGSNPCRWLASHQIYGSPGIDEVTSGTASCQPADGEKIIVSELNYNPLDERPIDGDEGAIDGDEFEFIELKNIYTMTVGLGGFTFTDGIQYTFPATMTVEPNEFILLAHNPSNFAIRYPTISVDGDYSNNFSNGGEAVELSDDTGTAIISFEYDDKAPWPEAPDGDGYTLIRQDITGDINHPCSWRASTNLNGSPKADDPASQSTTCASPTAERLLVSELNYHPKGADEGTTDGDEFEFIELYNAYTMTLNLADVTFTAGISYTFASTDTIGAGEYLLLVRNATQFATRYPDASINGSYQGELANTGEQLTLLDQQAQPIFSFVYSAQVPWPQQAAGAGHTLTRYEAEANPANPNQSCSWRASSDMHGSPGASDSLANGAGCDVLYLPLLLFN